MCHDVVQNFEQGEESMKRAMILVNSPLILLKLHQFSGYRSHLGQFVRDRRSAVIMKSSLKVLSLHQWLCNYSDSYEWKGLYLDHQLFLVSQMTGAWRCLDCQGEAFLSNPFRQIPELPDHRLMSCRYTCNLSVLLLECSKFSIIKFSRYNLSKRRTEETYDDSIAHHLILFIKSIVMVVVSRAEIWLTSR